MDHVIKSLKRHDKVFLVYSANEEPFQGFVDRIDDEKIILHEYMSDIYRTFSISEIREIVKL